MTATSTLHGPSALSAAPPQAARSRSAAILTAIAIAIFPSATRAARVKDLAAVQGVRENELFGYGLVVGLAGSGDSERVLFTSQSVAGMLGRMGIRVDAKDVRARNVAAVMVTAKLPAFSRPGAKLDVAVASLGNARSLAGGVLLLTPLNAADGQVYAVAQGSMQVGGFEASGAGSSVRKNTPTSGRIPGGATIERSVTPTLTGGPLVLGLHRPDFTTASRIAAKVNEALGPGSAKALDPAAVEIAAKGDDVVALVAKVEALEVEADAKARVVVSERTGTVVAGERVRIRPVMVSHGGLQVSITSQPVVSQPGAFSQGGRTVVDRSATPAAAEESRAAVALPSTSSVEDLAKALDLLGASPRDLVSILQAMKAAGALDAELEVI